MNEFSALRARARKRRDDAIIQARTEYETALAHIDAIERGLAGRAAKRGKRISASIESVIPRDTPFTTEDVVKRLEAMEPGRIWSARAVTSHLCRLRDRGLVRRIKRASCREMAVYARAGAEVNVSPIDDLTLPQVIQMVLNKPMTAIEIAVTVLEAGYRSTMTPGALRNCVVRELGRGPFRKTGGKWWRSTS